MKRKTAVLIALTSLMSLSTLFSSYAEDKTITSIPISLSWDSAPRGGAIVGNIYASSGSSQFIVEGASYLKDDDVWAFGERPVVEVDLSARDGYVFSSSRKEIFSISGCNAQYKQASVESDGCTLTLQVNLSTLDGALTQPASAGWSGNTAVWDKVEGCSGYEVRLYRGNSILTTVAATDTFYDFTSYLNLEGSYTFSVRTTGKYATQDSTWYSSEDFKVITRENAWLCSDGHWNNTSSGWRFTYKNGEFPISCWRIIHDKWYFFNQNGYMAANSYVRAVDANLYYWVGDDGAWQPEWDTDSPNLSTYRLAR